MIKGKGRPKWSLSKKRKLIFENSTHRELSSFEIAQENPWNRMSSLGNTSMNGLDIHKVRQRSRRG